MYFTCDNIYSEEIEDQLLAVHYILETRKKI